MFAIIVVDYFMKWVVVEALSTITTNNINRSLYKVVVYQFGISQNIIFNNIREFDSDHYHDWCIELGIKVSTPLWVIPKLMGKSRPLTRLCLVF